MRHGLKALSQRLLEEVLRLLMQRRLVLLQADDVVRALVDDGLHDFLLRPDGIDRHDASLEAKNLQQSGDRR